MYGKNARKRLNRLGPSLPMILLIAATMIFLLWMFITMDPFQSSNPFLREATIGQSVLGDWRYGGTDASGQMKFYDAYQSVLMPGNSTTFAADGQFVVVDGHSPSTITFEPPIESTAIGPTGFLWVGLLSAAVFLLARRGRKRPLGRRFRSGGGRFSRR